jgi:hypothetical protein
VDKAFDKTMQRGTSLVGVAYLSGPFTAVRDLISGVVLSAESFGTWETMKMTTKGLIQGGAAVTKTIRRVLSGEIKAHEFERFASAEMIEEALAIGAIREDFIHAMLLDERLEERADQKIRSLGNKALFLKQSMDRLARAITMGTSLNWLRATQEMHRNNPDTSAYRRRLAALKRLGFEGEIVADLMAGKPEAIESFARAAVAEKQYTYSIAQHPLFMGNPSGITKIMFQFQRWTFQRGRDLIKNVMAPVVVGTKVKGKTVRDPMPLMRLLLFGAGAGELLAWLRELLTDKERREASLEEISNADATKLALVTDRLTKDLVLTGGLGLIGDYGMMLHENITRGPRWRDPLKPPLFNAVSDLRQMVTSLAQQGASPSVIGREIANWFSRIPPIAQVTDFALESVPRRISPSIVPLHTAKRDAAFVRTLARRFGEEHGYDVESKNTGAFAKDEYTERRIQLYEALLIGDIDTARKLKKDLLEDGVSKTGLKTSVRNRQPIKVGLKSAPKMRREFLRWAKQRIPGGYERIKKIQKTYELSARRLGLM